MRLHGRRCRWTSNPKFAQLHPQGPRRLLMVDPLGNRWTYVYDTCMLAAEVDPLSNRTSYTYDRFGNRSTVKDALGNVTTYDAASRIVTMLQGGVTTTFTFDDNGNQVSENNNGALTQYAYDDENRMKKFTDTDDQHYTRYDIRWACWPDISVLCDDGL